MINKMKKLTLVASKSDIDSIANELLWLSSVEITETDVTEGVTSLDTSSEIVGYEQQKAVLAEAIDALAVYGSGKKKKKKEKDHPAKLHAQGI